VRRNAERIAFFGAITVLIIMLVYTASSNVSLLVSGSNAPAFGTASPTCPSGYKLSTLSGSYLCDGGGANVRSVQWSAAPLSPVLATAQRYVIGQMSNTLDVFRFQYYSGIILFVMVIGLVAAALFFSYLQFSIVQRIARAHATFYETALSSGSDAIEPDLSRLYPVQQAALGPQSISAQTSYLGFAILIASLGFFYLYLANVYPISMQSNLNLDKAYQQVAAGQSPAASPPPTAQPSAAP